MRRPLAPLLCILAGCGSGGGEADRFVVRDSAGVAIAESAAPAWGEGEAWTIEAMPSVRIGVVDGAPEYQFEYIRRVLGLSDGRMVVVDYGGANLRWYDPEGRHLVTSGGQGGGPGEFTFLATAFLAGDSVVAYDGQHSTMLVFGPDGAYVRMWALDKNGYFAPPPLARLPDGTWLSYANVERPGEQLGRVAFTNRMFRIGAVGAVLDTLFEHPGAEGYLTRCGPDNTGICNNGPIFGLGASRAIHEWSVHVGNGDGYDVRVHDARDGRLVRRIRRLAAREPAHAEDASRYLESVYERYPPERQPEIRRRMEDVPAADSLPSYQALHTDALGNLWVERYRLPWDDVPVLDVFDPDGRWLGEVAAPAGLEIHQIGEDRVLGVVTDETDVPFVVRHRLRKPQR